MPQRFSLLTRVIGYFSKPDKTNAPFEALVSPSQNMIVNDQEKVATRAGYTIFGVAGSGSDPVEFAFDWSTSKNTVINLRGFSTTLQAYFGTVDGVDIDAWTDIGQAITFTTAIKGSAPWWNTSEGIDLLLIINGEDKIYEWSGGVTTLKSATANTITKNGSGTWANARFLIAGTRKVEIGSTAYTYTGGEGTDTLTGVTPNPTGEAADSIVYQQIRLNNDQPADGYVNDFIRVDKNQVWIGSNSFNEVYVSKDTSFIDYTLSTPRKPGEGALLVLDNVGRGFLPLTGAMLITAGRDDWYKSEFAQLDVSGTLTETLKVKKLKTSPGMAAQSQDLIDGEYFLSFEPTLRRIIEIDLNDNLITENISDLIKPDFDAEDFTNAHLKRHRNRTYIASPVNSNVWINETRQNLDGTFTRFWQPPQIMPLRRLAIISDLIHGHSSGFNETYKLFDGRRDGDDGTGDVGTPISFNASYAYRSYRDRANFKKLDQWLTEGFIKGNTKITHQLRYDFEGAEQVLEKEIDGSDDRILFETIEGLTPLGTTPLGLQEASTQQPKFRQYSEFASRDFFEIQVVYFSSAIDDEWTILSQGGNVLMSPNKPIHLTR